MSDQATPGGYPAVPFLLGAYALVVYLMARRKSPGWALGLPVGVLLIALYLERR